LIFKAKSTPETFADFFSRRKLHSMAGGMHQLGQFLAWRHIVVLNGRADSTIMAFPE